MGTAGRRGRPNGPRRYRRRGRSPVASRSSSARASGLGGRIVRWAQPTCWPSPWRSVHLRRVRSLVGVSTSDNPAGPRRRPAGREAQRASLGSGKMVGGLDRWRAEAEPGLVRRGERVACAFPRVRSEAVCAEKNGLACRSIAPRWRCRARPRARVVARCARRAGTR